MVNVAGFGRQSNAPDPLKDSDNKLHFAIDRLHSGSQCKDAYTILKSGVSFPNLATASEVDHNAILPELFLCTGGYSQRAACAGDMGGPVFVKLASGKIQVIGVTSFGFGRDAGFCTIGPDFATRVSFNADWIRGVLVDAFHVPSVQSAFASWPVAAWGGDNLSSAYVTSRCSNSNLWQCSNGDCIPSGLVCDGTFTCADFSDENFHLNGVRLCAPSAGRSLDNSKRIPMLFAAGIERSGTGVVSTCGGAAVDVNTAVATAQAVDTSVTPLTDTAALEGVCAILDNCSNTDGGKSSVAYATASEFCARLAAYVLNVQARTAFESVMRDNLKASCANSSSVLDNAALYTGTNYTVRPSSAALVGFGLALAILVLV